MSEGASTSLWNLEYFASEIASLRRSASFRGNATNAFFSLMEYVAQPVLMILSAPYLLGRLGLDRYGIWMLVSSFAGTFGIFQIGLGDATIKYVSKYKGRNDREGVSRIISGTLALSGLLGAFCAFVLCFVAPFLVHRIFRIEPANYTEAIRAIQIGGLILWIQGIYQVFSSALRAWEEFGPPTKISVAMKAATILGAVCLAALGHGVVGILLASASAMLIATCLQAAATRKTLHINSFWPRVDREAWREVLGFGVYSWIQNAAGVAFSQADRLLIAAMLGTASLAYYTLCLQVTQQIHGLVAALFSFLFPHISAKYEAGNRIGVKKAFRLATFVNVGLSLLMTAPLVLFGGKFLTIWMGPEFAAKATHILVFLAVGFFTLSLNVVPHFTLLGLGKVRFLSIANMAGGVASMIAVALLIPPFGLVGAAAGRLFYGPVISVNFWKVEKAL